MRTLLCFILLLAFTALLSACGDTPKSSPTGGSIKAVIKPTALTAEQNVAGINLSITIPYGVEPPLLADGKVDVAATVEIVTVTPGNQNLPGATYTPATAVAPGKLAISAIVASGFKPTDEITIHLKVATGTFPVASDFSLLSFEAFDTNGVRVTGLNPILTTNIH
ncbi:MAG: hypothetical protein WC007_03495 [Pelobacteraceae bacterium]